MIYYISNFKKTTLNNIFTYTNESGETLLYDFNQLIPLEINNNKITLGDDLKVDVNTLIFHKTYNELPKNYYRLLKYGKHTFYNKMYYYNKDENKIIVQKNTSSKGIHYYNLTPSTFNKRIGYTLQTDENKSIIVFPTLIIQHMQ